MTTDLQFKHHTIPVINHRSVNCASQVFEGIHISFNPSVVHFGCKTTSIVLQHRVFFNLNGDHRKMLAEAAREGGAQACIDYFIKNLDRANHTSEHREVVGEAADPFKLAETAIEVLGQPTIDRLAQASKALNSAAA